MAQFTFFFFFFNIKVTLPSVESEVCFILLSTFNPLVSFVLLTRIQILIHNAVVC